MAPERLGSLEDQSPRAIRSELQGRETWRGGVGGGSTWAGSPLQWSAITRVSAARRRRYSWPARCSAPAEPTATCPPRSELGCPVYNARREAVGRLSPAGWGQVSAPGQGWSSGRCQPLRWPSFRWISPPVGPPLCLGGKAAGIAAGGLWLAEVVCEVSCAQRAISAACDPHRAVPASATYRHSVGDPLAFTQQPDGADPTGSVARGGVGPYIPPLRTSATAEAPVAPPRRVSRRDFVFVCWLFRCFRTEIIILHITSRVKHHIGTLVLSFWCLK